MSKRVANSKGKNHARNHRLKLSLTNRNKRNRMLERLQRISAVTESIKQLPDPGAWKKFKNKATRFFRRGIQ